MFKKTDGVEIKHEHIIKSDKIHFQESQCYPPGRGRTLKISESDVIIY